MRPTALDVLGREVAVPADGRIDSGRYRVSFDASFLASCLYGALLSTPSQSAYRVKGIEVNGTGRTHFCCTFVA